MAAIMTTIAGAITINRSSAVAKNESGNTDQTDTLHGVSVTDLDSRSRQQFNVPENVIGAVVTEVDPASAAAEAGLKPGDVITEINRHPVKNAGDAVKLTERAKDRTTLLRVWSDQGSRYVVVDEGKAG